MRSAPAIDPILGTTRRHHVRRFQARPALRAYWPRRECPLLARGLPFSRLKENQAIRPCPGDFRDADVVRLYVAMGDSFLLEVLDGR